ncbi:MAG: nitroreductase family protein [Clostridiales bacterium]|nr:nitroreductase family protein [Clostridiales bacterium]MCF8023574.1 nitroreductase family protein [Clostridiales bacterium]
MKAILERRSIRKYQDKKIPDKELKKLLQAAMAAPSAGNQQPWEFIVLRDKGNLENIIKFHPRATMLKTADAAIVVCGNEQKETHKGFWVQDCSAATENILIAAQESGIGAVWLGIYPREERVKGLQELLNLPEYVYPLCVISLGYPAEEKEPSNRYDETRIHDEKW